jgi:hypothetical protein
VVFSESHRSNPAPATYSESTFAFLDRVAGAYWERIRILIETWFCDFCPEEATHLRSRLRSHDDQHFRGAFWELYCHETLRRLNYEVTCHPDMGTGRRPDFLATNRSGRLFVEATVTSNSAADIAAKRREDQVYDALNRLNSPDFYLALQVESVGSEPPSAAKLRPKLERWLQSLDPNDVAEQIALDGTLLLSPRAPAFEWREGGWEIRFLPIPRNPKSRGQPDARPIGMYGPASAFMVDDKGPIRRAVAEKANSYGSTGLPFVVALNAHSFSPDDHDVIDALFGSDQITITANADGATGYEASRAPDGVWFGRSGIQYRRVSGVLVAHHLAPWNVLTNVPTLWHHPDAEHPIALGDVPWRQAKIDRSSGKLSFTPPTVPLPQFRNGARLARS